MVSVLHGFMFFYSPGFCQRQVLVLARQGQYIHKKTPHFHAGFEFRISNIEYRISDIGYRIS